MFVIKVFEMHLHKPDCNIEGMVRWATSGNKKPNNFNALIFQHLITTYLMNMNISKNVLNRRSSY